VEAQEWYEGEGSLAHAVSAWENKGDDHDEVVTVILGEGGYHRFPVLETGEVVFSRYSGSKDVAEKAKALGFRVI
jgi:hypothetical protein